MDVKKIGTMFVLSLFLLSLVPSAFAEDIQEDNVADKIAIDALKDVRLKNKLPHEKLDRMRDVKENRLAKLDLMNKTEQYKKYAKKAHNAREVLKHKMDSARKNFLSAKEHLTKTRHKFNETKVKFQDAKEKYKQCKESDGEECQELRVEAKKNAVDNLMHAADMILGELEKIKSKIESSEDLSEEEAAELLEKVNFEIQEVEQVKSKIENLGEDATIEDIKAAAKELRELWSKIKHKVKQHAGHVVHAKIGGVIVRMNHLSVKLDGVLERAAENGKDTSVAEGLLEKFNSQLDEAEESYEKAVEAYKTAENSFGRKSNNLFRKAWFNSWKKGRQYKTAYKST